ncbi:hypothetical protein RMSM_01079 [Rhodopirellula maiorica SM1]|uniref:Uncharacterized protein n=1 Tax=Rhodopirellula maiorica SM1 TaxID=1265738 RepID=M5S2Y6_9BACT|nr:hypothetical protein [Rhodopirellula maiorica]EMI22002.1 hypothetical protein RMSM_01079 [Rhodopirellula maiorica SM1]
MNGYLEQLTARALGQLDSPVRPRIASRFELPLETQSGESLVEFVNESTNVSPTDMIQDRHNQRPVQNSVTDARATVASTPNVPPTEHESMSLLDSTRSESHKSPENSWASVVPPVPEVDDRSTRSLTQRLDQLDTQLANLTGQSTPPAAPVIASNNTPRASGDTTTIESHHHHESREVVQHTENLRQVHEHAVLRELNPKTPIVAIESELDRTQPSELPTVVIESDNDRQRSVRVRPDAPTMIERTVHLQPNIVINQSMPRHQMSPPKIIVEQQPVASPSHTVTVTIGRIEVRSPKQAAPTLPKPQRANPRIMSLDDYVRRRAGGAS